MTTVERVSGHIVESTSYHDLPVDAVYSLLQSSCLGLDDAEVEARRHRYGPNVLPRAKRRGLFGFYFAQFKSAFIYLLFAAAVVTVVLGQHGDALFILVVLQLNALIGTYQEWRAQQRVEALENIVPNWVLVRRSGSLLRIRAEELVPGDVVFVESGVRVPADLRIFSDKGLVVDESLLTGESVPVTKNACASVAADAAIADRRTMLHAGTVVTTGRGEGLVVATAAHTELGRIAEVLARPLDGSPPLLVRMAVFTRRVALVMMFVIGSIAVVEALRGSPLTEIFLIAVALAVAAIPEGLPVAMTIALTVSVSRMAKRNVIVRRLFAVEGLGACTLIASDKTGTLTCNELTAKRVYLPGLGEFAVSGEGYGLAGRAENNGAEPDDAASEALHEIAVAGVLASEAGLRSLPQGGVAPLGDAVDAAFHVLVQKVARDSGGSSLPEVVSRIPYEPEKRYAAAFYRDGPSLRVAIKGAFETVMEMCAVSTDRGPVGTDAEVAEAMRNLAARGFRVLAVAEGTAEGQDPDRLSGLRLLGLVGVVDPLRAEAAPAVAACRNAGVEVRMITGDHPATAFAIARDLGMAQAEDEVVTGAQLARIERDQSAFDKLVNNATVFARIAPLQKLQIVEALKRAGHYVAVTGDGVNDAPALRAAHIGAAMGSSGTDVARQASDLILADDNFASIVGGIEDGRLAYANIRKVIYLLISTGSAEIALFLLSLAAGYPMPLSAVQLLWLNLATQGAQHVGLAFEKAEPGILNRPPRPPKEGIFERVMVSQTILSGAWMGALAFGAYVWFSMAGLPAAAISNHLLLLMVLFENAHVLNCRSETRSIFRMPFFKNPILLAGVFAAQALHILAMNTPGISDVLALSPVDFTTWFATLAAATSIIVVMEVFKWWLRRHGGRRSGLSFSRGT